MNRNSKTFYGLFSGLKRLRLFVFLFFAVCIIAISIGYFSSIIGKPYIGLMLSMNEGRWSVQSVDPNGIALDAGIKVGDIPTEINNQPAETFLEQYESSGVVFGMLIKQITVTGESGKVKTVSLINGKTGWQSSTEAISWFIVCLIFWIVGFYVFFKRPNNLAAFFLCLCSLVFGLALSSTLAGQREVFAAPQIAIVTTITGPWLLLHFFRVLPEERRRFKPASYLVYLPALVTVALFPLIGYVNGQPSLEFRTFRMIELAVVFAAIVVAAILNYVLAKSVKTRQQMRIVLFSCIMALVPFFIFSIIPAAIWKEQVIPSGFYVLFMGFIPLGLGYAVITQKLMNIEIVIRHSIIYGLITIIMAIIMSGAILPVVVFRKSIGILEEILISLLLGAVATILFGPAKNRIEIAVDKFFFKDRYDYRQIIKSLSYSLNSLNDVVDSSRLIVGTTVNTLKLDGGCLFVASQSGVFENKASQGSFIDSEKQNQLFNIISDLSHLKIFPNSFSKINPGVAFIIPLVIGDKTIGILCLSQKTSKQEYSSNDVYLLQEIAIVGASALKSSMLIRDVSIRDTFVSIVSHELATPLTSILGYADLILNRDPPENVRNNWLRFIIDNGNNISKMVEDMLNITRIQSGKVKFDIQPVSLSEELEKQIDMLRETSEKHEFLLDIEPNLPLALIDRDKFSHILGNLLSNAVKYSPKGGWIKLTAWQDFKSNKLLVIVADQGIGISEFDKASLFQTFHRIRRPETQGIKGSGLGLFIAKEWIEAMKGEIWLESELNKGTKVFLRIPYFR